MSLRDECDCPFPGAAAAGLSWTCPDCGVEFIAKGDGDWRCLSGPSPAWSDSIRGLADEALLALAAAVARERARRGGP